MLIAFREAHRQRKAHDRADRLNQAAVRHALRKGIECSHRHTADGRHENTGTNQRDARICALDKRVDDTADDDGSDNQHECYHTGFHLSCDK